MCYLRNLYQQIITAKRYIFRAWMSIRKFTIHEEFAEQLSTSPDLEMPWTVSSVALERQPQAADGHSDVKPAKHLQRGGDKKEGEQEDRWRKSMHGLVHILESFPLPLGSNSMTTDGSWPYRWQLGHWHWSSWHYPMLLPSHEPATSAPQLK